MKRETEMEFGALMQEAMAAGAAKVAALNVVPMVVQQKADPMNDSSPVVKQWFVEDGVCGFAWVKVKGVGKFANWLKANKFPGLSVHKGYPGGLEISVHAYNQSLQKKEAFAYGMADVLKAAGISAYASSRMD